MLLNGESRGFTQRISMADETADSHCPGPVYTEDHSPFHPDEKLPCRVSQDSAVDSAYHLFTKHTKTLYNIIYGIVDLASWWRGSKVKNLQNLTFDINFASNSKYQLPLGNA